MKIKALLPILSIAALTTAAQAQWLASQPGVVTANPGAAVSASFALVGTSVNYSTGAYNLSPPCVVWVTAHPFTPTITISEPAVVIDDVIYNSINYGDFVFGNPDGATPTVTVSFTVPANAVAGTTYLGTVYEPVAPATRANVNNAVGTIAVYVN